VSDGSGVGSIVDSRTAVGAEVRDAVEAGVGACPGVGAAVEVGLGTKLVGYW
jgi:hypothetical protein